MNSVNLVGNLARDPEVRYSPKTQNAICRMTVAVNDGYGENRRTSFIPVVVFGKSAENCERFLKKGSKVAVNGRIQTGSYEKDGRTIYTTDVIANNYGGVEFLSSGGSGGGGQSYGGQQGFGENDFGGGQPRESQPMSDVPGDFQEIQDDDIPF